MHICTEDAIFTLQILDARALHFHAKLGKRDTTTLHAEVTKGLRKEALALPKHVVVGHVVIRRS